MRRESNLRENSCSSLPVEFHGCEQPQAPSLDLFLCSQVLVVSTESIFHDMLKSVSYTFSLARSHKWVSYNTRTPHFHCFACLVFLLTSYNHQTVSFLSLVYFFSCCFTLMWCLHLVLYFLSMSWDIVICCMNHRLSNTPSGVAAIAHKQIYEYLYREKKFFTLK